MSAEFSRQEGGLLGVSGGGRVEEVGRDRGGAASAMVSELDEEKEAEAEVVMVGGMGIDSLDLRLV